MNFTSLDDALNKSFIKSLPHLTRLDLSANEIKHIELVLSFTEKGNEFYMNYSNIANYLHLGNTKNKAKSVGNIVAKAKAKGYITSETTHHFNGKNGGSSANLKVNKILLETQIHEAFNRDTETTTKDQISRLEATTTEEVDKVPSRELNSVKSFIEELQKLDEQVDNIIKYDKLEPVVDKPNSVSDDKDVQSYINIKTLGEFEVMLKRLIRKESMTGKKSAIQYLIDNSEGWDIREMKKAFEALVLKPLF